MFVVRSLRIDYNTYINKKSRTTERRGRTMNKEMTIREFLKLEIDVDVVDDYAEDIDIAFVGPVELTEKAENYFGDALDVKVTLENYSELDNTCDYAVVNIDNCENPDMIADVLHELFVSAAGYCSEKLYDLFFK